MWGAAGGRSEGRPSKCGRQPCACHRHQTVRAVPVVRCSLGEERCAGRQFAVTVLCVGAGLDMAHGGGATESTVEPLSTRLLWQNAILV